MGKAAMSRIFRDESSGARTHYNSDFFSGETLVILADGTEFRVSAAALAEFRSDDEDLTETVTEWAVDWQSTDGTHRIFREGLDEQQSRQWAFDHPGTFTLLRRTVTTTLSGWEEMTDDA